MILDFTLDSLHVYKYGCWHSKPSDGHCCFVYCPNSYSRFRNF